MLSVLMSKLLLYLNSTDRKKKNELLDKWDAMSKTPSRCAGSQKGTRGGSQKATDKKPSGQELLLGECKRLKDEGCAPGKKASKRLQHEVLKAWIEKKYPG